MITTIRRFRRLLPAAAFCFAAPAVAPAAGDPVSALPFTPPAGWQTMPAAFIPKVPVTWGRARSIFDITELTSGLPADALAQVLKSGAEQLGKLTSQTSAAVCGSAAPRVVIRTPTGQILTEQAQTIAGATYVSLYIRPESTAADPAILRVMSTTCDDKALAQLAPPNGWRAYHGQILGIWIGASPTATLTAIATNPEPNVEGLMDAAVATTIKNPNLTVISHRTGTLCGNPAFFSTVRVKAPNSSLHLEVQFAATQSAKAAYALIYAHPVSLPADAKVSASLDSLCAPQAPPPAPTPS